MLQRIYVYISINNRPGLLTTGSEKAAPKKKLVVGVGTFGRAFILANPAQNGVGARRIGIPRAGPFTKERGYLSYYEVSCLKITATKSAFVVMIY